MVWSDQAQYPFYVYDDNGKLVAQIDNTGLYVFNQGGGLVRIGDTNNPNISVPIIEFFNQVTDPTHFAAIYGNVDPINTPLGEFVLQVATKDLFVMNEHATTFWDTVSNKGIGYDRTSGYFVITNNVAGNDSPGWRTLNLANGWIQRTGTPTAAVKILPDGTAVLRGSLQSGTAIQGTVIGSLPNGATDIAKPPFGFVVCPVGIDGASGGASGSARIVVRDTTGNIELYGATNGPLGLDGANWALH